MKTLKTFILLLLCLNFSCNSEDIDDNLGSQFDSAALEKISQDEELFEIIKQISTDNEDPILNITCIDFKYPLAIFTLDENDEFVSLDSVLDDADFSLLLENINPDYSISVSFPIEATLESGEEFLIETKEDLRSTIDECLGEEIVNDCNGFLSNEGVADDCKFRVGYSFNSENTFLGGIFEEDDGFTTFDFEEESYNGSWTGLMIENELHINISLIEASEEAETYFNHDWVVEILDANSLKLTFEEQELILNKKCNFDLGSCSSFHFEACENELDSEISDFNLLEYRACILEILEFEEDVLTTFHLAREDAENNQSIFVKLIDEEVMSEYLVEIILVSISCQ